MKVLYHEYMKSFPILSVLATILAMLVSEYIFHFPSKMLHDGGAPLVQITLPGISERDTTPITPKGETVYCTVEYAPVCGADSITYPNACEAGRSRTSVAYTGTCDNRKVEKPLYEEVAVSTGMMSPDTTPTVST